jgi:hypothetical protein
VAFHLKDDPGRSYDEFHVADRLRMVRGAPANGASGGGGPVRAMEAARGSKPRTCEEGHASAGRGHQALGEHGWGAVMGPAPASAPLLPPCPFPLPTPRPPRPPPASSARRQFGWVVPAYTLARANDARKVLRIVCRWDFSPQLAAELLEDFQEALEYLDCHYIYTKDQLEEIQSKAAARAEEQKAEASKLAAVVRKWRHTTLNARGKC